MTIDPPIVPGDVQVIRNDDSSPVVLDGVFNKTSIGVGECVRLVAVSARQVTASTLKDNILVWISQQI